MSVVLRGGATPWVGHEAERYLRTASFTFSPACFRLPEALSFLPFASCDRSLVAFPAASSTWPFASWSLFLALSTVDITCLSSLGCESHLREVLTSSDIS